MAGEAKSVLVRVAGILRPLDQALLLRTLSYDGETGIIRWRDRSPDLFNAVGFRSREDSCDQWNARYAGALAIHNIDAYGYRYGPIFKTKVKAHRVIFCMEYGHWPEIVDHIDGTRTHNVLANLREVTLAENNKNLALRSDNKFGHHGVYRDQRGGWRVHVMQKFVGRFPTFDAAVAARVAAEVEHRFHPNHGRAAA